MPARRVVILLGIVMPAKLVVIQLEVQLVTYSEIEPSI